MPLTEQNLVTAKCDAKECKESFSSYSWTPIEELGWYNERIMGKDVVLCPDHKNFLQDFLGIQNDGFWTANPASP